MTTKYFNGLLFSLLLAILPLSSGFADTGEFALGVKAGTLGVGVEGTVGLLPGLNLRTGANAFGFDFDVTTSDVDYNLDADLLSFPALVDWHPFEKSGFRLSAGVLFNQNKADADATTESSYTIDGTNYSASELGSLTGKVDFNELAPYLGIGWGNALGKDKRWSFSFDLGAVYQGEAKVSLSATGPIAADATFQENLAREEKDLEDELEDYTIYPVVSLGIAYKF